MPSMYDDTAFAIADEFERIALFNSTSASRRAWLRTRIAAALEEIARDEYERGLQDAAKRLTRD
jgi:hypothetical protein